MAMMSVRGAAIRYEVFGSTGSWIALSPGSRRPYHELVQMAESFSRKGYRVLLHDRRNCGASDVVVSEDDTEAGIWADDLHDLLQQLGALPAFIGGCSSGCRLSLIFATRYPADVKGLLLWRITGGSIAAERLAHSYYGQFLEVAQQGGMKAICESEHFRELINANPGNRDRLMSMDVNRFMSTMTFWRDELLENATLPAIGVTEADLQAIAVPVCLISGNDQLHPPSAAQNLRRLLSNSELHQLVPPLAEHELLDEWDRTQWADVEPRLEETLAEFISKVTGPQRPAGAASPQDSR